MASARPAPAGDPSPSRQSIAPLVVFASGFMLLLGSAGAVVVAQFWASKAAAWTSIGLSLGAVVLTVVAVFISWRR